MKKAILKYTIVFFGLLIILVSYSTVVCLLPTEKIKKNVGKDISNMVKEGNYPYAIINKKQYQMDNFTDALVLSINCGVDNQKPFSSVMYANYHYCDGKSIAECVQQQINDNVCASNYPRYWHGNSFLLRPFLFFTDYSTIRWILYTISNILLIILSIKLYQRLGIKKTVAFVVGLLFVNIFVTQFSIQFFPVITLAVIACILMCIYYKNRQKILLISFIVGCLTSYLDLFTTQLLTCGLPLIVYLSIENDRLFKDRLLFLFSFCFLWAIGYVLMWASKCGLATIFTDINVFENAFYQAMGWSKTNDFSRFDAIRNNFLLLPRFFICMILTLLTPLVIIFFNKKAIKTNLLLLIVATLPYFWYFIIARPCWWHWWFSYRTQAIAIIAVFFIFINFISWDKIKQLFNRRNKTESF